MDNTRVHIEYLPLFFPHHIDIRRYDFMYKSQDRSRPILYAHTESETQSPIPYIVALRPRLVT